MSTTTSKLVLSHLLVAYADVVRRRAVREGSRPVGDKPARRGVRRAQAGIAVFDRASRKVR